MLPLPSSRAYQAFVGCSAIIALGLWFEHPGVLTMGGGGLIGLALCLSLSVSIAARLRAQRLSFSWRVFDEHTSARTLAGRATVGIEIMCRVRNPSSSATSLESLLPSMVPELSLDTAPAKVVVPARSRLDFTLRIVPRCAGQHVLHGLSVLVPGPLGLFHAPLYFPTPLLLRVLPREPRPMASLPARAFGAAAPQLESTRSLRPGEGHDIRELRELQPGDPFKAIAWKASARRGRLLVREMEQESHLTRDVVVDVSFVMRLGDPGERALDRALDVTALLARDALHEGDRVTVVTVDGREVSRASEGAGQAHMRRVYDALVDCVRIVDADLTEADADEVRDAVLRYLRRQEGQDTLATTDRGRSALARRVRAQLGTLPRAPMPQGVDPDDAVLRLFCRMRGIHLPYREATRNFAKGHGLSQAARRSVGRGRTPRQVLLLCDLAGVVALGPMEKTLRVLRARSHDVVMATPVGFEEPSGDIGPAGSPFVGLSAAERLREAQRRFAGLGVTVVPFRASESAEMSALRILKVWSGQGARQQSA